MLRIGPNLIPIDNEYPEGERTLPRDMFPYVRMVESISYDTIASVVLRRSSLLKGGVYIKPGYSVGSIRIKYNDLAMAEQYLEQDT